MLIPKSNGLITCSDFVSLISKCKCGPPDPPVSPEKAIISPFFRIKASVLGNKFPVS